MNKLNRRDFLKTSIFTTASLSLLPALGADNTARNEQRRTVASRITGANSDVRFAVVGFGGRGTSHINDLREVPGTRLVALCDVDRGILDREARKCLDRGEQIETYTDIRKLLESKNIDVVGFATPNHWHALGAIWAMQAGKDVYVEKPVSHNVWEGRRIVEVARQLNRIVQTGTQSRSSSGIREGIAWVREGHIGKILRARGFCYKRRPSIGKADGPQPIPPEIDYDLWCGPAPKEPLMRKKLHYDWHWVWPTGNGDLGNQGIHQMDMARWALGETALSPRVLSVGGRFGYVDDGTTPNTMIVFHDYPTAPLIFEVRGLPSSANSGNMDKYRGVDVGVVVDCEGGAMTIPTGSSAKILDKDGAEIKKFSGNSSHFANFIDAVRSRKFSDLTADILEGHLSSALCHTGNISYRLGNTQQPGQIHDAVKGNPDLAEVLGRMEEHLAANAVDLKKTPATLGAVLKMNPKTERFIGNRKANQQLTRDYRKPFVVPARI
ncbi:MAG TPA: Gfo/Idh/MocA family oxidoreductase [Candidatus Paceibacterota bacterium]|nr:Gfo/Idh/MocA family oxidoreductase [Verrucomicrobiota bacterium]HSA12076.1 Gfo/Idh/MocA family oxidoreductase [Candidatus Paceibacterota bacterium]